MTKETKTIRVSLDTLKILKKYGKFGEHWDDCIWNIDKLVQTLRKERRKLIENIGQLVNQKYDVIKEQKKQKEKVDK